MKIKATRTTKTQRHYVVAKERVVNLS